MKIHLELDVAPVAGGPVARFERVGRWQAVPRVDDYVELVRGSPICSMVESVIFEADGTIRVVLVTYEEDDAARVATMLRSETSRWMEDRDGDAGQPSANGAAAQTPFPQSQGEHDAVHPT